MAIGKNNGKGGKPRPGAANGPSDLAMDEMESGAVDEDQRDDDDRMDEEAEDERAPASTPRSVPYARVERPTGGFFDVYRPGQGGRVRWWFTAASAALFVLWGAYFTWEKLTILERGPVAQVVKVAIPTTIVLGGLLVVFYLLTKNRKLNDFLIATEGEMKKVNWSTRREVIGSTKVVIFVMVVLAVVLFVVDLGLIEFFRAIGVLKLGGSLLFGGSR